jgi:hypothetical protein
VKAFELMVLGAYSSFIILSSVKLIRKILTEYSKISYANSEIQFETVFERVKLSTDFSASMW